MVLTHTLYVWCSQTVGCLVFKYVLIPMPERKCANGDFFPKITFPFCWTKIATDFPSVLIVYGIPLHTFPTPYTQLHKRMRTPVNTMVSFFSLSCEFFVSNHGRTLICIGQWVEVLTITDISQYGFGYSYLVGTILPRKIYLLLEKAAYSDLWHSNGFLHLEGPRKGWTRAEHLTSTAWPS